MYWGCIQTFVQGHICLLLQIDAFHCHQPTEGRKKGPPSFVFPIFWRSVQCITKVNFFVAAVCCLEPTSLYTKSRSNHTGSQTKRNPKYEKERESRPISVCLSLHFTDKPPPHSLIDTLAGSLFFLTDTLHQNLKKKVSFVKY
jgi:hypothetical protein